MVKKKKTLSFRLLLAAVFLLSFFLATFVSAAEYYVDGTKGSDSYDGTALTFQGGTAGPKATVAAGLALLGNGDDLKIREGVYYESSLDLNQGVSGIANDRITISNYNGEDVFLTGGYFVSDSTDTSRWTNVGGNSYRDIKGNPTYIRLYWMPSTGSIDDYYDVRLGYHRDRPEDLDEEGEWTTQYVNGYDNYFHTAPEKDMTDYSIIGVFVNNDQNKHVFTFSTEHDYVTIDGINFIASMGVIKAGIESDYITITNSKFLGLLGNDSNSYPGPKNGIFLGGDNCIIENSEGRIVSSYFISGANQSLETENLTIRNNKFSYNAGNVIHTTGKGMRIQNNEFSHYSVSWWYTSNVNYKHAEGLIGHTPGSAYIEDLIVENNYFHNADAAIENPFGIDDQKWDDLVTSYYEPATGRAFRGNDIGFAFAIACGLRDQGDGLIYRNNLHEGKSGAFDFWAEVDGCDYKNIEIYGNVFANVNDARDCEGCTSLGLSAVDVGRYGLYGVTNFENLKIYNNLFYNFRTGLHLGARTGTREEKLYGIVNFLGDSFVKNNIFLIQDGWSDTVVSGGIYFDDSGEIAGVKTDYNLYYRPDGDKIFSQRNCGGGQCHGQIAKTLTQWRNDNGFGLSSVEVDPKLFDPDQAKYWLSANSPAIDTGVDVGLVKDYLGKTIPFDGDNNGSALPDIGPYEYQNSNNPADVNVDGHVNIKDIQACIKVITGTDTRYQNQCKVLATPETTTNIKDIQVIVSAIVNQ